MNIKYLRELGIENLYAVKVGKMQIDRHYINIFDTEINHKFNDNSLRVIVKIYKDKDGCIYGKDIFTNKKYYAFESNEVKRDKIKDGECCIDSITPITKFLKYDQIREKIIDYGYINFPTLILIHKFINNKINDNDYYECLKKLDSMGKKDIIKIMMKKR